LDRGEIKNSRDEPFRLAEKIKTVAHYYSMTIAGGTLIIFQFGGELYPTEVRGVGIGLASFLGGIALTIIPFINYLVSSGSSGPRWRPHSFSAGLDDLISAAVHGLLRC
jgi:hypothetical protein